NARASNAATLYNRATAFQPWKDDVVHHMDDGRWSFNGATAFQPWKARYPNGFSVEDSVLQWGHGVSAVERPVDPHAAVRQSLASMGPRRFSRGKLNRPNWPCNPRSASMGPRRFSRGKPLQ